MKIKKAVIPAAGFGTRMLPQTKAMPKEMLPIVDKPVIQYIVEEIVAAGITDIIIVTGWHKRAIEDHFDYPYELEQRLIKQGKRRELKEIQKVASLANFTYVRQKQGIGNAVPIKSVQHLCQNEPFLVLWGDILADPDRARLAVEAYEKYEAPILCGNKIADHKEADKYGFVKGKLRKDGMWQVNGIVEKPGAKNLPSPLAVYSGYVLTPEIFPLLEKLKPSSDGELYLTAAIDALCQEREVLALQMDGVRQYDTGNKLAYFETFVEFALRDQETGKEAREIISRLLKT